MSDPFIKTCYIAGYWANRDTSYVFSALVAETLAVYYWCEFFVQPRRSVRVAFCVIGQRGLSDYVVDIAPKVMSCILSQADTLKETWGYKFGLVISLREALRRRRDTEMPIPEYQDQCNASTYRAKKQLRAFYKVRTSDQPVQYDIPGFKRGKERVWGLEQFKTPVQVLNEYSRRPHVPTS